MCPRKYAIAENTLYAMKENVGVRMVTGEYFIRSYHD